MEVRSDISQVLAQMRHMKGQVQEQSKASSELGQLGQVGEIAPPREVQKDDAPEFSQLLKMAVNQVNETQQNATSLATAYEKGDPTVDIPEVMIAAQKASVAFQAMTQVRNKLVSAYEEIMKMPI